VKLGAFSISLSVKDIHISKAFYEKMGFIIFAGDIEKNYLILKNEETIIGLFQGMFENNLLTFNPGWDQNASNLEQFDDIRKIQVSMINDNIDVNEQLNQKNEGPASFTVVDPDGNIILFDQHR
jgi:catechol 2,3-dioxygenase-like lactoylglutathione lyase family enzyme